MTTALGASVKAAEQGDEHETPSAASVGPESVRSRREEVAIAFFGTWMLIGLFLDGWAHQAEKPETFFSPWHGVLYSGFAGALLWFGVDGLRSGRGALRSAIGPTDRLAGLGLGLFVAGAVGDGLWHEIFGIEVDLEALLSPTHLLLLIGGFLMLTTALRAAVADPHEDAATLRGFMPVLMSVTLAAALVSFFTMYLSAFEGVGYYWEDGGRDVQELLEIHGVGAVLVTNMVLLAPLVYLLRRWRTPFGTFTFLFGGVALAMAGLEAFRLVEVVVPAIVGGLTADLLARRGARTPLVAGVTALVLWSCYFAVVHAAVGIEWAAELVAGSVALAVVSGLLLATVAAPARTRLTSGADAAVLNRS